MINKVQIRRISEVLSFDNTISYEIPMYQREYTWGQREWEVLFDDLEENQIGYFLGSIIYVYGGQGDYNDVKYQVIDGQQRITTLSLFLLALYTKLIENKTLLSEDQSHELYNLKNQLILKNKSHPRLTLQVQGSNRDDYYALLSYKKVIKEEYDVKFAGLRRIWKAYNYFSNTIEKYITLKIEEKPSLDKIELIFELINKVNSATVVTMEVESYKEAYMLFESLNNRGVPLSAIDLIKNTLISISNDPKSTYQQWQRIIKYLSDDYSDQERFFRQYYNAYRDEINAPYINENSKSKSPLGFIATRSNILDIYERLIKDNYSEFLNTIEDKAKVYSILINNSSNEENPFKESLLDLERIQGAPSYLLLLYLLSEKEKLFLNDNQLNEIINYLTKFFVRRNITDFPNTRNLNKIFMDLVKKVETLSSVNVVETIKTHLKTNSSSDEVFREKLYGPLYISNVDSTRFILCYYEKKFKTKEIYTDLWLRDEKSKKYIWTIEHIFPEGDRIPEDWVKMIADGDRSKANELQEQYVHTLGNLTLTGYNSNLSNMSFENKKNRQKDGKFIGYKNGLELNKDVVSEESWTIKKITDRTKCLVNVFMSEFAL